MSTPLDASFADNQKGRRKMFIRPNQSTEIRNWAYCCVAIRNCQFLLNYYAVGKTPDIAGYHILRSRGRAGLNEYCRKKAHTLSRKIARYTQLRDKFAAELGDPDARLLQLEDILNMVGSVIEITPRHSRERVFKTLLKCSPDGSCIDKEFDACKLLAHGYGR